MGEPPVTTGSLAAGIGATLVGDAGVPLVGATHDSRRAGAGMLFCCVPGDHHDGHDFAAAAVAAGAAAVLCSRRLDVDVPQLLVDDPRAAMASAAAAVHHHPSQSLEVVGVTGTNGKTTVVTMLGAVLAAAGHPVEVIGTLTGARTTPESTDLQAQLADFRDRGITHVAMEVSSHALELHRVDGTHFAVAVFTNLGEDHLDFHGTPEAYFSAKSRLFEAGRCDLAVLNVDDVHGRLLRDVANVPVVAYSVAALDALHLRADGSSFTWRGHRVELSVPGRHNVANALAVAEAARALGVGEDDVVAALAGAPAVPGRFERVDEGQGFAVVVDYAHTPDALENVLAAARELVGTSADGPGRLIVVFGCGGDRDAGKRPAMGRVVTERADVAIVTNDNPRSEDPLRIISEIRSGCVRDPLVLPDRRAAIRHAVALAGSGGAGTGDVVVIAGKGHEQGQQFADRTEAFDDRVVAREELRAAAVDTAADTSAGPDGEARA